LKEILSRNDSNRCGGDRHNSVADSRAATFMNFHLQHLIIFTFQNIFFGTSFYCANLHHCSRSNIIVKPYCSAISFIESTVALFFLQIFIRSHYKGNNGYVTDKISSPIKPVSRGCYLLHGRNKESLGEP
jgi:hypothetical protein